MSARGQLAGEVARRLDAETRSQRWTPLPHQEIPVGGWYGWLGLMGRGCGKTDTCSNYVTKHVNGPACLPGPEPHRVAIVAPTGGDAANSCYYSPSGIRAHDPKAVLVAGALGGAVLRWPNGSTALLVGAHTQDDVDRLRAGGNRCLVWFEELAAMRYMEEAFDQALLGLRIGPDPRWIASTTPKPRKLIKQFAAGFAYRGQWTVPFAGRQVVVQHATTDDNPHLPAHIRQAFFDRHGGTTLGAQELEARVIDEDQNALWRRRDIEAHRIYPDQLPELTRITVGVDPSGGAGEQGIVVVGRADLPEGWPLEGGRPRMVPHGYVLDDMSCQLSPDGWGQRAVNAAIQYLAGDIVAESDYGRDMPLAVIAGVARNMDPPLLIPVRGALARAVGNKRTRARPVAALAERGYWHHVGTFPELEDQMCTWTEDAGYSPDRIDAMTWGAWHLRLVSATVVGQVEYGGATAAGMSLAPGGGRRG